MRAEQKPNLRTSCLSSVSALSSSALSAGCCQPLTATPKGPGGWPGETGFLLGSITFSLMTCWPSTPQGAAFQGVPLWWFCTTGEESGTCPVLPAVLMRMTCTCVRILVQRTRSCPLPHPSRHAVWEHRLVAKCVFLRAAKNCKKKTTTTTTKKHKTKPS